MLTVGKVSGREAELLGTVANLKAALEKAMACSTPNTRHMQVRRCAACWEMVYQICFVALCKTPFLELSVMPEGTHPKVLHRLRRLRQQGSLVAALLRPNLFQFCTVPLV